MTKMKKVESQIVDRHIDFETGEVKSETQTNVIRFPQEPPYVKMYIDDLCLLINIPDSQKEVLLLLLKKIDYEGFITLSPRYRKNMCETLGIKDQTLRNRLVMLCKSELIRRHGTNEFEVNPHFFARGEWRNIAERRQAFELKIKYTVDGKEIRVFAVDDSESSNNKKQDDS